MKNLKPDDVVSFERIERQLHVFYREISALSKKTPNDGVNKFKLSLINNCISEINNLLGPPLEGFLTFDVDSVPTNSDVALVIGQYVSALLAFRKDRTDEIAGNWYWMSSGRQIMPTESPYAFTYREK